MSDNSNFEELVSGIYHALRTPRRRYIIQIMKKTGVKTFTTRELAQKITSTELDVPEQQATGEPYRNAYNALSQTHLPTLSDAGIIIYDPNRQTVTCGANFALAALILDTNLSIAEIYHTFIQK
jgi:hypothetical protein